MARSHQAHSTRKDRRTTFRSYHVGVHDCKKTVSATALFTLVREAWALLLLRPDDSVVSSHWGSEAFQQVHYIAQATDVVRQSRLVRRWLLIVGQCSVLYAPGVSSPRIRSVICNFVCRQRVLKCGLHGFVHPRDIVDVPLHGQTIVTGDPLDLLLRQLVLKHFPLELSSSQPSCEGQSPSASGQDGSSPFLQC